MTEWFEYSGGSLRLQRFPHHGKSPLQAWDAADRYVLKVLEDEPLKYPNPLIIDDGFGALALALLPDIPSLLTDSQVTREALKHNQGLNHMEGTVQVMSPLCPILTSPGVVLVKIPKQLDYLEFLLHRLRPVLSPHTPVFAAGMVKHISRNARSLFERILGPTTPSLAWKKSRVFRIQFDPDLTPKRPVQRLAYSVSEPALSLADYPNVFSRGKLDGGTRLLLAHLPKCNGVCIDLGCGNGLLGIAMAKTTQVKVVRFIDVSHLALATSKANWQDNGLAEDRAEFMTNHALDGVPPASADLILCNPPFHQGQTIGDEVAWRMFTQSAKALKPGGQLFVVGNRHLAYHRQLKRIFGAYTQLGGDRRFVVLRAERKA